jgi:pyocin large subunit-like protein
LATGGTILDGTEESPAEWGMRNFILAGRMKLGSQCTRRAVLFLLLAAMALIASGPGFHSKRQFDEHYAKHGAEFGAISQSQYLVLAQALRDAPVGGPILETKKPGGVITRFDRRKGYFGAYNGDGTIRTFFIPNDGERYFHRQARRPD